MPYAALDLDGTLYPGTAGLALLSALAKGGHCPAGDAASLFAFLDQLAADQLNTVDKATRACQLYARAVAATDPRVVEQLSHTIWQSERRTLFSFTRPLVDALHRAGHTTILISGSPHEIVRAAADDLGITHCQGAVFRDGHVIRAPGIPGVKESILPADAEVSFAFGNSASDSDLLARAVHPIAFEPLPLLRKAAEVNGWTVVDRTTLLPTVMDLIRDGEELRTAASSALTHSR